MTVRTQSRRDRQPVWAWLRLCLLLTLWQAPIPLVHAHAGHGWEHASLARHVQDFHGDAAVPEDDEWHWHLVLPAWGHPATPAPLHDGPDEPEPVQFEASVVRLHDSGVQPGSDLAAADFMDRGSPPVGVPVRPPTAAASRAFLTTYLSDVALHQLLRVNRC